MTEVFCVVVGKPNFQGTLGWTRAMSGTREMCEDRVKQMRTLAVGNIGKVEMIPLERFLELKAQGLVSG